ncbi:MULTISPECIES: DUF4174 domain-containing protein [unclassified Rhizobium]|jgi:hypothetical protein|uniref:DUF4174 domain-containing protein n=1 Tax=unclassified Rhizobium TaxID=2613769 RepID=UPI000DD9CAE1|nr:DUF4174 domain-containing protein [Rhizobium sp. UBA1881]
MLETQADKSVVASLAQFRWNSRVIVIFPDKGNARTARQENQLMAERPGLQARDVVVLKVAGDTVRPLFGAVEDLDAKALARDLAAPPPGEFMTFLIGKDGTVKLTIGEPISAAELFTIIDAMPMRSAEAARR